MAASVFADGQGGQIIFGTTTFPVTNWRCSFTAEAFDTTNTSSAGWIGHDASGPVGAQGSFESWWDSGNVPTLSTALNMQPAVSASMTLSCANSGLTYLFKARISEVSHDNPAKGICTFNGNFVSTGVITYPT